MYRSSNYHINTLVMQIHTYIHTNIHTYINTTIHTSIHTYIQPSIHISIHPRMHIPTLSHSLTCLVDALRQLSWSGIPASLRPLVWGLLSVKKNETKEKETEAETENVRVSVRKKIGEKEWIHTSLFVCIHVSEMEVDCRRVRHCSPYECIAIIDAGFSPSIAMHPIPSSSPYFWP